MAAVLMGGFRVTAPPAAAAASQAAADYSNTKELGKVLYSQYLLPLLFCKWAIIGRIHL
jgi:NADH-quinone oxidoreductase subunit J